MKTMYFVSPRGPASQGGGSFEACAGQRAVPVLSAGDLKALAAVSTNEAFTLEKSANMYAGVKKLRAGK